MNSIFLRPLGEKFFYVLKKQCGKLSGFCAGCIGDRPFGLRGWLFPSIQGTLTINQQFSNELCAWWCLVWGFIFGRSIKSGHSF